MPDFEFVNLGATADYDVCKRFDESGSEEEFERIIEKASKSDFLINGNGDKFRGAQFSWIFRLGNWEKIKKGFYDDEPAEKTKQITDWYDPDFADKTVDLNAVELDEGTNED